MPYQVAQFSVPGTNLIFHIEFLWFNQLWWLGLVQGLSLLKALGKGFLWPNGKEEAEPAPANDEEYSPLGLSVLEQFASGMSVPWLQ